MLHRSEIAAIVDSVEQLIEDGECEQAVVLLAERVQCEHLLAETQENT